VFECVWIYGCAAGTNDSVALVFYFVFRSQRALQNKLAELGVLSEYLSKSRGVFTPMPSPTFWAFIGKPVLTEAGIVVSFAANVHDKYIAAIRRVSAENGS